MTATDPRAPRRSLGLGLALALAAALAGCSGSGSSARVDAGVSPDCRALVGTEIDTSLAQPHESPFSFSIGYGDALAMAVDTCIFQPEDCVDPRYLDAAAYSVNVGPDCGVPLSSPACDVWTVGDTVVAYWYYCYN